jgi:hypothetical protein
MLVQKEKEDLEKKKVEEDENLGQENLEEERKKRRYMKTILTLFVRKKRMKRTICKLRKK